MVSSPERTAGRALGVVYALSAKRVCWTRTAHPTRVHSACAQRLPPAMARCAVVNALHVMMEHRVARLVWIAPVECARTACVWRLRARTVFATAQRAVLIVAAARLALAVPAGQSARKTLIVLIATARVASAWTHRARTVVSTVPRRVLTAAVTAPTAAAPA